MGMWKYVLIACVVVGGFGAGYTMKQRKVEEPALFVAMTPYAQPAPELKPAGYDPTLVLPPPSEKGAMLDMPIDDVRKHFSTQAGLLEKEDRVEGPALPAIEPRPFPINIPLPENTPLVTVGGRSDVDTMELPRLQPPTIRLPAPADEPSPVARRVIHRQIAMWHYVNQRELKLNFDVTRRGPSGVAAVELWARRSADRPYECVDRVETDRPPFTTRLGSEGTYEYRLVFVSGSGVKSALPTANDLPDVYVCLDTTPPIVELLTPVAEDTGVVKLRWKASDANFDEAPIRLEYSTKGEQWQPVSETDLANNGEYTWKIPAGVAPEVHLRVQARDKAGNVGVAVSSSKFAVDLTVPDGRITGVVER